VGRTLGRVDECERGDEEIFVDAGEETGSRH